MSTGRAADQATVLVQGYRKRVAISINAVACTIGVYAVSPSITERRRPRQRRTESFKGDRERHRIAPVVGDCRRLARCRRMAATIAASKLSGTRQPVGRHVENWSAGVGAPSSILSAMPAASFSPKRKHQNAARAVATGDCHQFDRQHALAALLLHLALR